MAKSKKPKSKKRGRGRRPGRSTGVGGHPHRIDRPTPEELELERLLADVQERAREAHAPDTAPGRVAEILAEDFAAMPAPVGIVQTLVERGSDERASAVGSELRRRAGGTITALTFDAELARAVDGDPGRSDELLEQALDSDLDPDATGPLAEHMLAAGRTLDALGLAEDALAEDPRGEAEQATMAEALWQLHARRVAGEKLAAAERKALARFADRTVLYELREALGRYVEARSELQQICAEEVRDWDQELPEGASLLDPAYEGLFGLAVEQAWLLEESENEELDDSWFENLAEPTSAIQLFAADPETPRGLATAARNWGETVTYGLWQLADPAAAPGVWLTDLVSGVRRYVAVPPEQLDQASRWTVLIGALVAVDGTWRTTGTVIPLRPGEGDAAAELAREMTIAFFEDLSGERIASRRRRKSEEEPDPYGVLVGQLQPAPQPVADLMSKMVANLIPEIAAGVMRRRSAGIGLTNMDGHRVREITAELTVADADAVLQRLAGHPDFRVEDGAGELSWWGRELTKMEREGMLAQVREQFGAEAVLEAQQSDKRPRWLRGRLRSAAAGLEVEVNSEERLKLLLELLAEHGIEAKLKRRSTIDPAQDLPAIPSGTILGFGTCDAAVEAWLSNWAGERVPALGGLTPRAAARSAKRRTQLEAMLREFEHDVDQLRRQARPAPDIDRLRAELGIDPELP